MMSACMEVVAAGLGVTVQDRGRVGYRSIGVPVSGALDGGLMTAANALLRNPPDAAVLEIALSGPTLKAISGPVRLAFAGEIEGNLHRVGGQTLKVLKWETATLFAGDVLSIGRVAGGVAYVAFTGGLLTASQLGSRSTYLRAAIGSKPPAVGDRIRCKSLSGDPWMEYRGSAHWHRESGPIRVIPGPQDDYFVPSSLASFFSGTYRVTRDMDRMGLRLEGEPLVHTAQGAEIISDGVVPGSIQVPANGQPIILMADCQTTGGYPKIATVIRADLDRLAHLRPGDLIRFAAVTHAQAIAAMRAQRGQHSHWVEGICAFRPAGVIDEIALYGENLLSGMVRGDE